MALTFSQTAVSSRKACVDVAELIGSSLLVGKHIQIKVTQPGLCSESSDETEKGKRGNKGPMPG